MSVLHVETLTQTYVGKGDFVLKIQLHKSPDLDRRMKQSIKNLKVGEAIKFPNGLKVKLMDDTKVVNLLTWQLDFRGRKYPKYPIKKTRNNKDRTYDTKHTSI
nr:hypothetical protein [uncultured Mediterranean phage uvMED]